jgi:hypothetical protein
LGRKGNGDGFDPRISTEGRRIAFEAEATSLVPVDGDRVDDIYVKSL